MVIIHLSVLHSYFKAELCIDWSKVYKEWYPVTMHTLRGVDIEVRLVEMLA